MSKFLIYFGFVCAVSIISVSCLPVPDETQPAEGLESIIENVAVENVGKTGELSRPVREANPNFRSHHRRRPHYHGGCGYNCGGGGGGGFGGSGAVAQAGANSGGFGPFGGGGGSSASAQAASFNFNTPFGNFGGSQSFSGSQSQSFGK